MLQWMGGSRKKIATSRMSTQKRQKQYFEQRKRQQQNLQMMGSDNCSDSTGISGQNPKEHRSLDILNLLNLSTNAQQCNSPCMKGEGNEEDNVSTMLGSISTNQPTMSANMNANVDSYRFEEARAHLCCQIETSPKKVLISATDKKNAALIGPPSESKKGTNQYSEFSVIDLLCDDEPNATVEKCLTSEVHVSFSLEGLGKVGIETPVHSPEHQARIPSCYSPLLRDGRKSKFKNLDHVLDDIELEVDTIGHDIKVSPINSSNFAFDKIKRSSAIPGDCKHYYDHANTIDSSISEEFFYTTDNSKEGIWNARSSFLDVQFDDEEGFDTSWKKTFQMGSRSPELLRSGTYKMGSYDDFEDLPLKNWSSAATMKEINMSEPPASFSKDQYENDLDFYMPRGRGARCSKLDGNVNSQNLIPEDVRDNSSLLSDESSSSTVVRCEAIKHSSSGRVTEDNRRNHRNVFASTRNNCSNKEEKWRSMSNPSKRKSSHYSNSILQEELGTLNSWQFEERYVSVDKSSVATSRCQELDENFSVFGSKNKTDPFYVFNTPELRNKTSASFGGFKKATNKTDSPPCSFTSDKFAFACSNEFQNAGSWPISPSLSPDFQFKEKPQDSAGFHRETSSTDMSVQGSASKGERKVKLQKDSSKTFGKGEDFFMGDNELSSEKKMERHASNSNNYTQECEGTVDANPKTTQCLETVEPVGHVEEISSSLKKTDKHESQVDKEKNNCDAETPLKYKITKEEEMKNWKPEGRIMVSGKHSNEQVILSGKVMFESYVFQLLCVQKVLKEACTTTPTRNNAFLEPGSNAIYHQI